MRVWIDQDCCTGAGLCVDHCPELFIVLDDGIGYVHDGHTIIAGEERVSLPVPHRYEQAAIDAVERCPGECIYVEPDDAPRRRRPTTTSSTPSWSRTTRRAEGAGYGPRMFAALGSRGPAAIDVARETGGTAFVAIERERGPGVRQPRARRRSGGARTGRRRRPVRRRGAPDAPPAPDVAAGDGDAGRDGRLPDGAAPRI